MGVLAHKNEPEIIGQINFAGPIHVIEDIFPAVDLVFQALFPAGDFIRQDRGKGYGCWSNFIFLAAISAHEGYRSEGPNKKRDEDVRPLDDCSS